MFFWYLVKSDLSSVCFSTRVHWTSHLSQVTRKKHGHVLLVTLYLANSIAVAVVTLLGGLLLLSLLLLLHRLQRLLPENVHV